MSRPENPPAFPVNTTGQLEPSDGMTLRDWFAGQALIGISCNDNAVAQLSWSVDPHTDRARLAYCLADAMLAAREVAA